MTWTLSGCHLSLTLIFTNILFIKKITETHLSHDFNLIYRRWLVCVMSYHLEQFWRNHDNKVTSYVHPARAFAMRLLDCDIVRRAIYSITPIRGWIDMHEKNHQDIHFMLRYMTLTDHFSIFLTRCPFGEILNSVSGCKALFSCRTFHKCLSVNMTQVVT